MAELEVRDLQLGALAGDDGPVLAPVELESFTGTEGQRYEGAASGGLLGLVALGGPRSGEGGHAVTTRSRWMRC